MEEAERYRGNNNRLGMNGSNKHMIPLLRVLFQDFILDTPNFVSTKVERDFRRLCLSCHAYLKIETKQSES